MSEDAVEAEVISTPVEKLATPSSWVLSALGAPEPSETRVIEEVHPPELAAPSSWVLSALGAPEPSETRVDEEESVPVNIDELTPRKKCKKKRKPKKKPPFASEEEEGVQTSRDIIKTTVFRLDQEELDQEELDEEEQVWRDERKNIDDDAPETLIGMLSYM
jgi:hypothetical protein